MTCINPNIIILENVIYNELETKKIRPKLKPNIWTQNFYITFYIFVLEYDKPMIIKYCHFDFTDLYI